MNGQEPGKADCRSPTTTIRKPTYAGTCMDLQPRPNGAPTSWPHDSISCLCPLIPVLPTACHLTTIWADSLLCRPPQRTGCASRATRDCADCAGELPVFFLDFGGLAAGFWSHGPESGDAPPFPG